MALSSGSRAETAVEALHGPERRVCGSSRPPEARLGTGGPQLGPTPPVRSAVWVVPGPAADRGIWVENHKGSRNMRVGVIGTGHVGLVTCATLASLGHDVVGTDSDQEKIRLLQANVVPFHEPQLPELVSEGMSSGRLRFTPDPAESVTAAEVVFICVGTPPRATGEANLEAV